MLILYPLIYSIYTKTSNKTTKCLIKTLDLLNNIYSLETVAYFAGGCFWCTEAVYQRLKGVQNVVPGYMGGTIKNPAYREVCTGRTGHAEAVKVTFDKSQITFDQLVAVFFSTHDPTTLNRQGADVGTQYRSAIFCTDAMQRETVMRIIGELTEKAVFDAPIVTEVNDEVPFYLAEESHQNYFNDHGQQPYCQAVISPKIQKFIQQYQSLLK